MDKSISIKDLRKNMAQIATEVENGQSFKVFRRSKGSFRIVPCSVEENEEWETIVDFTENGKEKGAEILNVLKILEKMNKE